MHFKSRSSRVELKCKTLTLKRDFGALDTRCERLRENQNKKPASDKPNDERALGTRMRPTMKTYVDWDVLGLQDFPEGDQNQVYTEFKEQLVRSPEGWYETGLPWKGNHPPLHNNEAGSLRRLHSFGA
ncbi:hypothetical protein QZH41_016964 [Actinostola sp. cb2023]|nr:hypothetical protein QZH41_016964 [Actinostola sp. cb2023]